jgi:hypothetical protein
MDIKLYETNFELASSNERVFIDNFAPLKLSINPFNALPSKNANQFNFQAKIYKIVYDWGDGEIETVKLTPSSFNSSNVVNYPATKESGDPRNVKKEHIYNLNGELKKAFNLSVKIHMFGIDDPLEYKALIRLSAPQLDGSRRGFFKNIHLIDAKMYGTDNKILYVFEGKDPSWVMPALVDWRIKLTDETVDEGEDFQIYQLNI